MLIKIYKIEQLVGKDSGKMYWKLETDKGNMSAFDKPIADKLYEAWGANKAIEVDAKPSKDKVTGKPDGKYVNIKGLGTEKLPHAYEAVGKPARVYDTPEKQRAYDEDSEQYAKMHQEDPFGTVNSPDEPRIMPQKPQDLGKTKFPFDKRTDLDVPSFEQKFNPTSMYVSYAKDIFNKILEANNSPVMTIKDYEVRMKEAINLVKQAHKAFS